MAVQQQISSDVLFIKHRKLYYILTSYQDSVVHKIVDILKLKGQFDKNIITEQIIDGLTIVQNDINENTLSKIKYKDYLPKYGTFYKGYESNDLSVQSYIQKLQYDQIKNILKQSDIATISQNELLLINDYFKQDDDNYSNKSQSLQLSESYTTKTNTVQYAGDSILTDTDNQLIINNHDYYFKLYIGDKLLAECKDLQFHDTVAKDLIFNACQYDDIYLKLYDKNNNYIKKYSLRKTSKFDLQIQQYYHYQQSLRFKSDRLYLKGYNIYHGNSICQHFHCNIKKNNSVCSKQINYQIIGCGNITNNLYLTMYQNSFVIVRFKFQKIIYLKDFVINSNTNTDLYSLKIRYGTQPNMLNRQKFSDYKTDFYCNTLDVRIDYTGFTVFEINSFDLYAYDLSQNDVIYSDYIIFNQQNNMFIEKMQLIDESIYTKYPKYITTKDNNSNFIYNNIKDVQSDYFQSENQEQQASIQFGLQAQAISGDISSGGNTFRYLYLQYQLQQKKDSSVFDLTYFTILNKKYNFPKHVILVLSDNVKRIYNHKNVMIDNGKYIEKWTCDGIIYDGAVMTQTQQDVLSQCTNDYFYFSYYKVSTSLVDQWRTSIFVKLGAEQNEYTTDALTFIDGVQTNGFIISGNYKYYKKPTIQPYYKLYTKQYNATSYQHMSTNMFNVTVGNNKRDFKILFCDGDTQRFKLYSIVFQNYNKEQEYTYNQFQQQDRDRIEVSGNNTDVQDGIIKNNFYNVMYSINYAYSSQLTGKVIQGNRTYFDQCVFDTYNKSNLHFQWESNKHFQYLILFDKFQSSKYSKYFLPFKNYQNIKHANKFNSYQYQDTYLCKQYRYDFEKTEIISKINIINSFNFSENVKYDYYYSYSNDNINWTDYTYYKPFVCFCAKFVKLKCIIKDDQHWYCDDTEDITLSYCDSDIYSLVTNNYFDSSMITDLQQNTNYMFFIRKYYNGQFFDSTLKLFTIGTFQLLQPITELYIDNVLYDNVAVKISGIDNIINIKFKMLENVSVSKFNLKIYCGQNLMDQYYELFTKENDYYVLQYKIKSVYLNPFSVYSYKVRYYDQNNEISEFSNYCYFYLNNIPTIPTQLGIIDNGYASESSDNSSSSYEGVF